MFKTKSLNINTINNNSNIKNNNKKIIIIILIKYNQKKITYAKK